MALLGGIRVLHEPRCLGVSCRALWQGFRKKVAEDSSIVKVSGHLELTPSPSLDPALTRPEPRSRKYTPPADLECRLEARVKEVLGPTLPSDWREAVLTDSHLKFRLLTQLAAELGHTVPNSSLQCMRRAGDVLEFYATPVKDTSKFDELSCAELPSNLKIHWEY
ncbi:39S ribosomal protein L50, mitochondrial isoform X2 [Rhinatrema bivittatum]|uniref:39S ribosomal protein L50, mitochondrial isoform X2 n=1 Tax=Rhinatrema bivittatum TaxID=194408 RepID=UPI00112E9C89|nr:39S ribosomal protein L50, mitochondrial isoform X2 [Rhinatrema bivittatum]